jgi:hypothetical protein
LLSKNSSPDAIYNFTYNSLNNKKDISDYFYTINQEIFIMGKPTNDFDTALQISIWLKTNIKGGPGLSEPSEQALRTMLAGKGGVCSDMAQVFNNFCVINDISVREWGTTSAPFNSSYGGHSFNEVFCKELDKWVLIDVYWGFLFYQLNNKPLGVVEFYQLKRGSNDIIHKSFIEETVENVTVQKNYLNPGITPFLICNYRSKTYDVFLEYTQPFIPIFVVHFIIYLLRRSYHYRFPLDDYKTLFS